MTAIKSGVGGEKMTFSRSEGGVACVPISPRREGAVASVPVSLSKEGVACVLTVGIKRFKLSAS